MGKNIKQNIKQNIKKNEKKSESMKKIKIKKINIVIKKLKNKMSEKHFKKFYPKEELHFRGLEKKIMTPWCPSRNYRSVFMRTVTGSIIWPSFVAGNQGLRELEGDECVGEVVALLSRRASLSAIPRSRLACSFLLCLIVLECLFLAHGEDSRANHVVEHLVQRPLRFSHAHLLLDYGQLLM